MKTEQDTKDGMPPREITVPVELRSIEAVRYSFDPVSMEPTITVEYSSNVVVKKDIPGSFHMPDSSKIVDIDKYIKLGQAEQQLMRDYEKHVRLLEGKDQPIEVVMQRAALLVYIAKSWENWSHDMHALFANINREEADKKMEYIYTNYVTPYYGDAFVNLLIILEGTLPHDIKDEFKQELGKMLLYAKDKNFATVAVYDPSNIPKKAWYHKRVNEALFKNGLGNLIPDYKPEVVPPPPPSTDLLTAAKDMLWYALGKISSLTGGGTTTTIHRTDEQKELLDTDTEHKTDPGHKSNPNNLKKRL